MATGLHRGRTWQAALLYASIAGISILHYLTPTAHADMWLHPVYARAYYVPLLLIALFWGWRAGLAGACVTTLLYAPHVLHAWAGEHEEYMVSQLIEMGMFFVVTAIAGTLADHERRQRRRIEDTATQLTQVNRKLQESFEQLRRAERLSALGELAAGLAHEIRNPLGSFEGALRIVSRPGLPEKTREEFRNLALGEVERLKELVSTFLDFARPPASRPSPTSPLQLLQSVEYLVSENAGLARVAVRTEAQMDLPEIMVDSQQIKQVLLNLALNSVYAMQGGGNLVLRASVDRGVVVFEVEDEGVGVPEENLEKIFDPFFTTRPDGTGLGLSVAYRIVTQHGGQIRARRNPDRGMTFAVELPLEAATYDATAAGFAPGTSHLRGC
jgi:signal transduction histidine kinase